LCIEVAETSLSRTSRAIGPNLDGLADRGVSLAFDNFGSGHASLTQLQDFPVDIVKLDRSCTKAVVHSERARNVAAGTIAAAERLGLGAIADGVETERQAAVLARLGYRHAQGFAFSPAVPAADLTHLIRS
jgi:EAL domain-containing protein (putative c-di-GMP-specific phosphodiesterase class I)